MQKIILSLGVWLMVLAGCQPLPASPSSQEPVPVTVACTVSYRPSVTSAGQAQQEETSVTLAEDGDRQTIEFEDMTFQAQYNDDQFEGRSLLISVTPADGEQEITRQLYQLPRNQQPNNQFQGGHGFTGLTYVYHPASEAELQFFCQGSVSRTNG